MSQETLKCDLCGYKFNGGEMIPIVSGPRCYCLECCIKTMDEKLERKRKPKEKVQEQKEAVPEGVPFRVISPEEL